MSFEPDNVDQELTVKDLLQLILVELRINNKFNEIGHDEVIKEEHLDGLS